MINKEGIMSTKQKSGLRRPAAAAVAILMTAAVFAWPVQTDLGKVYAAGETAVVAADLLNVRSGPGTGYSRIGSLTEGKTFVVTGSAKDSSGVVWYKFSYGSKAGYVSSKYVNIKQNSVTQVSNTKGTVNTKSDPLIVRSGPGTGCSKLGTIAKGKTFTIKGKVQDSSGTWWYTFDYNGKTGYVSSSYVKVTTVSEAASDTEKTTGIVNDGPLRVRSGPGTNYSILGTLAKGKLFTISGKAQNSSGAWWYKLTYNGKTGYVYASYVTVKSESGSETNETVKNDDSSKTTGTVIDGPLRVRTGPGTSYDTLGQLAQGKTFDVTGSAEDSSGTVWYKLTYNGKTGYVSSKYVKLTGSSAADSNDDTDSDNTDEETAEPVTFQLGTTTASEGLNVRKGPGTGYTRLTTLAKGTSVTITGSEKANDGKVWYKYQYSASQDGYICSDYVTVKTVTSDSAFEAYMTAQGFPESYKPGLRMLHAAHPQWTFKALKLSYSWSSALSKETANPGTNLVSSSSPVSYRSTASGAYNSSTGAWTKYDGSWYAASSKVVAYYMDPRNFLSESGIYQFMTHRYDASTQNESTVSAVISGSFMQGKNPGGGYSSYSSLINAAGKNAGVNPNVLAAMIIQEQGWSGSSLVTGTYSGYVGYYNFFNIGAYTTSTMTAVQRGLWYAQQHGWNTPYKSIAGGAQFYADNYVNNNQDTYYTKKFNVKNGLSRVATHQYMTNVSAAASEGSIVKSAFSGGTEYPVAFEIPVYTDMPASACQLP